ncbi:MAG: hypothetical protein LBU77_00245 [Clostridiales bacterium]|nr:hypothetical protein [Clostridiales bacterium]
MTIVSKVLTEFRQRLKSEGYAYRFNKVGAGLVYDGDQNVSIMENGDIHYKRENKAFAMKIKAIRDEVQEYMTAFLSAKRIEGAPGRDTRTLLLYNACELAARQMPGGDMDFVTWRIDRNGEREIGHYTNHYAEAKRDFAVRAGLIDRDRLFTETELTVIRSSLSEYLAFEGGDHVSWEHEKSIKDVIDKIDRVIVPKITEQAQDAENDSFEPEL